jgi:pyruvate dehydrogenase E1 component alpha subunit
MAEEELMSLEALVRDEVEKAIRFAEESPYPDASELLTDVYVSY